MFSFFYVVCPQYPSIYLPNLKCASGVRCCTSWLSDGSRVRNHFSNNVFSNVSNVSSLSVSNFCFIKKELITLIFKRWQIDDGFPPPAIPWWAVSWPTWPGSPCPCSPGPASCRWRPQTWIRGPSGRGRAWRPSPCWGRGCSCGPCAAPEGIWPQQLERDWLHRINTVSLLHLYFTINK